MGVPTYGRCFRLDDINNNGMIASASQPGEQGPYTQEPGLLGYNEVRKGDLQEKYIIILDIAIVKL